MVRKVVRIHTIWHFDLLIQLLSCHRCEPHTTIYQLSRDQIEWISQIIEINYHFWKVRKFQSDFFQLNIHSTVNCVIKCRSIDPFWHCKVVTALKIFICQLFADILAILCYSFVHVFWTESMKKNYKENFTNVTFRFHLIDARTDSIEEAKFSIRWCARYQIQVEIKWIIGDQKQTYFYWKRK